MPDSFYEIDGDAYLATELTRGPWDPGAQHAGPPAALIGRAIERLEPDPELLVARIALEILRPIPIGQVEIEAEVVRPGRRVQLLEATLRGGGAELIRARAWRIRRAPLERPEAAAAYPPPAPPESGDSPDFFATGADLGYHTAMEWRSISGGFREPGPATVWMRMGNPLLPDEEPSPLQRTLIAADVGNGISSIVDWGRHTFVNVDLTVHLERMPVGEWVCVDAVTHADGEGIGTSESVLGDRDGRIGRAAQTLLISPRPA